MYERAARGEIPWQWHGAAETPDAFYAGLREGALLVYSIEARESETEIGLLVAYNANMFHSFAYVSMYLLPEFHLKVWPNEAALLFANYLFVRYNLRNLYAKSSEANFAHFQSGAGRFFEVEGRLRERLLVNGQYQDLYILRLSREKWEEVGLPLFRHCTIDPTNQGMGDPTTADARQRS